MAVDGMGNPVTLPEMPHEQTVIFGQVPEGTSLGAAPGALDGVKPGNQTSEFRFASIMVAVINLFVAIYVVLAANNDILANPQVSAAVVGLGVAVSGWITTNYVNNRSVVKAAAAK